MKTEGYPAKAAICTWIVTGNRMDYKIGGLPSSEHPTCGGLWARFADGIVVDWGGHVAGDQFNKHSH